RVRSGPPPENPTPPFSRHWSTAAGILLPHPPPPGGWRRRARSFPPSSAPTPADVALARMRIRKHAARILSSLSIPTQSLASAAAGGRELGMHVCELNQSPWDAMAFTPPESVSFFPYQVGIRGWVLLPLSSGTEEGNSSSPAMAPPRVSPAPGGGELKEPWKAILANQRLQFSAGGHLIWAFISFSSSSPRVRPRVMGVWGFAAAGRALGFARRTEIRSIRFDRSRFARHFFAPNPAICWGGTRERSFPFWGSCPIRVCAFFLLATSPIMLDAPSRHARDWRPLWVPQELEEVEEDSGFAWCGHTEEQDAAAAAAAVSDVSGITAAESTLRRQVKIEVKAEQAAEEEEGEQRKRNRECYSKKRNTSSSNGNITKKTKRKITSSHAAGAADDEKVKVEMQISPPAAAAASTCKKSDGKGWHCKRPAQHPHSLCEYHLNQVRSYYGNGVGTGHAVHHHQQALLKAQDAALVPDNKKKNKKKKTATTTGKKDSCSHGHKSSGGTGGRSRRKPESDFFYYYSGFGPWRGKRRCGGGESDRGDRASSSNVDARDGDDEQRDAAEAAPRDGLPTPTVHDQAPDDLDDDDEDMDGGDHVGGRDGGDDVAAGRRRARKPIKARSLKSLL
ncbi:hypothetical protein Taro_009866, partial [Colocasia esculenta]|nr:hypothetical protein [Colocasia esculenta]